MSVPPAPDSLRAALDRLLAAPDSTAALVALQADLLNTRASRLVELGRAADAPPIARRAVAEARIVAETSDTGARLAVPLGSSDAAPLVALHELERATPLTLALAHERLELTSALARALHREPRDGLQAAADLASALVSAPSRAEGWHRAAVALAELTGARRALVALVHDGAIGAVADSRETRTTGESLARLKLVAGEVVDDGGALDAGAPLPPAARSFAEGGVLAARLAGHGTRRLVGIVVDPARPALLPAAIELLAAVRLPDRPLVPARLVDLLSRRLPWPVSWGADRRRRASARAVLATPLALLLLPVPASVSALVTIEALDQRVVAAPFDARIEAVAVQPGDRVTARRSRLVRLDSRGVASELADTVANLQAALSQADAARIDGRSDEERLARLRAQQFTARAELLRLRLAEADLRAPIDGIVGGDDLRQRIGAPVARGDTLFTVARPGRYRAEVRVPDRDIGDVAPGDRMTLALKAHPLGRPGATVARIYPIAEAEMGDNIFRVVAEIDADDSAGLLPGMEGEASIRTGWTLLGWTLLKPPVRWLRRQLWI